MTTAIWWHDECLGHVTPPGHPERVDRLAAIRSALPVQGVSWRDMPLAGREEVLRCHPARYVDWIAGVVPDQGWERLDGDTYMSPGTLTAALRAVGGMAAAVDAVLAGEVTNGFVAARPPGHHAETERPMGFCLFGTVAIGAKRALDHHGLTRVAVVDFDVHHGNGTQDLLWTEDRVMFASSHQMPLYPGSGRPEERGAHGQIINVPLRPGTGGAEMRASYDDIILPELEEFQPELILVSAGFDAHAADPLAHLDWTEDDFAWLTHRLCDLAEAHCGGRLVSTLEGGYDLDALAASVAAHVNVLKERGG
ncbi:MAG: histone deacetylase family protein [Rhodobacterales bacterium]|nr:histone deacetylase family protein [Rhodobacterales bacterium]